MSPIDDLTPRAPRPGGHDHDSVVIPVDFGPRSPRRASTPGHPGAFSAPEPEWDSIDDIDEDDLQLTPRQRRFVEVAARTLADEVYDAIEGLDTLPAADTQELEILSEFPPCTWTQPVSWWRRQARCFDDLADDTTTGGDPEPRCTGEEMALHLILSRARSLATDPADPHDDLVGQIPVHPNDSDWHSPLDYLFQDHDVLTLFDDTDKPSGAVNLDPPDWFIAFPDRDARDPGRGFRR